jgi:ATP-dependent protease HslVU (ClpYQ) peptidase subunit
MTTILAIQGDNWAVMGSDSKWSDEYGRVGRLVGPKVFTTGKYVVGVAGDTRGCNLLQHVFMPPAVPPRATGNKLTRFMVSTFVPAYKTCLEEHGLGRPQYEDEPAKASVSTLILVGGQVFQIDEDYGTEQDAGRLYSVGSGGDYGLGAMMALTEKKKLNVTTAKQVLLKALSISAKVDSGTGPPFFTVHQQV